jgi:hypothetical protein
MSASPMPAMTSRIDGGTLMRWAMTAITTSTTSRARMMRMTPVISG